MYPGDVLDGLEDFLDRTREYGVVEAVRVSAQTIHVLLRRDLSSHEAKHVRELAQRLWRLDQIVLAVLGDLRRLETKRAG